MNKQTLLCIAIGLLLLTCQSKVKPESPVILIVVDTLRSDRLPSYGYNEIQTPNIDHIFNDGVRYDRAYSQAPLTLPSHASLFSGLLPHEHGVRDNAGHALDSEVKTLSEVMRQNGYFTAGFVSSMVLRKETGIAQGFDLYDDDMSADGQTAVQQYGQRRGDVTLAKAKAWLEKQDAPFFLFLHLYDPHTPYEPPEEFRDPAIHPYDNEIVYVDHLIGDFINFLKRKGLYDKSTIVFTSDHGEGLGDHGEDEHGFLLYREAIQIPLAIKYPNQARAGEVLDSPMALKNVGATVLSGLGLDFPGEIRAKGQWNQPVYAESINAALHFGWYEQASLIVDHEQVILSDKTQSFDLGADFNQLNPISKPAPPELRQYHDFVTNYEKPGESISQEDKEMLESLGYSGSFSADTSMRELDETAFLTLFKKVRLVGTQVQIGQYEKALPFLQETLQRFPAMLDVRLLLGTCLTGLGRFEPAEYLYLEGLSQHPNDISLLCGLIHCNLSLGKPVEQLIQKAIRLSPKMTCRLLEPILIQHQAFDEMVVVINEAQKAGQDDAALQRLRLWQLYGQQKCQDFLVEIESSMDPPPELLARQADCLGQTGDGQAALALFDQLARKNDNDRFVQSRRALLLFGMNRPKDALNHFDTWLGAYPEEANIDSAVEVLRIVGQEKLANQLLQFKTSQR